MRRLGYVCGGLALLLLLYIAGAGLVFQRVADGLLRVGTIGALLETAGTEPPDDPRFLGYRGTPAEAFDLPYDEITLTGETGDLPAWVVPAAEPAPLVAIYVHGIAGAREDGYHYLPVLQEAGVPVLMLSYRNDPGAAPGLSGAYAFGLEEWRDVEAAADWWTDQGAERFIVIAESMGGGITGQWLMRTAHQDRLAGIALDSPAVSFRKVLTGLVQARGLPLPDAVTWSALRWQAVLGAVDMRGAEVEAVLAEWPGPLFLAHRTADGIVPVSLSRELAAERTAPTLVVETGADHLGSWAADPRTYDARFMAFLEAAGAERP